MYTNLQRKKKTKTTHKLKTVVHRIIYHGQVEFIPDMQAWINIYKSTNVMHIKRLKDYNYVIISIYVAKTFIEFKHSS